MNVVIFGTGSFYQRRKQFIKNSINILLFIDNDKALQGSILDGKKIEEPNKVLSYKYDYVVLASGNSVEMKQQLVKIGVSLKQILYWDEFLCKIYKDRIFKLGDECLDSMKKRALISVPVINYAGGFIAAYNLAIVLKRMKYYVVIVAPYGNFDTIKEVIDNKIDIWIFPSLLYLGEKSPSWIVDFDLIFANSLQNILFVTKLNKDRKIIWWLHEHSKQYIDILKQYDIDKSCNFPNVNIYAVSELAKNNFRDYFSKEKVSILPLGISDFYKKTTKVHKGIVIAIIGNISPLKNQKEFIKGIKLLPNRQYNKIECWIIGRNCNKMYYRDVVKLVNESTNIKMIGEVGRKKMEELFEDIDVVVCSSVEETLSIAIVEGMMNKKICLTNTNTGIAEYIDDGVNGFLYKEGDIEELKLKLETIIDRFEDMDVLRENARKTYQQFFSMRKFKKQIKEILSNCYGVLDDDS